MSYLNQPRIFFSGKFRADPSTVNNTPDNFNPNANFPPNNGNDVGNNIQLYWNPNGTGQFALDCTVTKVCENGDPSLNKLVGQPLVSQDNQSPLDGAKLVDLDPMQQNVTELWGLELKAGDEELGAFLASAYTNAWVQVVDGRGDYAGSAMFQSVLLPTQAQVDASPTLQALLGKGNQRRLSISLVLRSFNSSSHNYLINDARLTAMNQAGVPTTVTDKLVIIASYNQSPKGEGTPGQIPSTGYFTKLVQSLLTADESKQYLPQILKTALVQPYVPLTDFDFTFGQAFGVIGTCNADEPPFMTIDRMLTPTAPVGADSDAVPAYFAPFTVHSNSVTVNLGNALPSSAPASLTDSHVNTAALGTLTLCYFKGAPCLKTAVPLGEISYQCNDFYIKDGGLAMVPYDPKLAPVLAEAPLGILSDGDQGQQILLREDPQGYYLRANQFVFRMNPGEQTSAQQPRGATQDVSIFVRKFGKPAPNTELNLSLMSSLDSATYTNGTLGTGGSTGLVNMGEPTRAVHFPKRVCTDERGVASFQIRAGDPGNPRGYMDGQIYFLQYALSNPGQYIQSPDDLISLHIYSLQPAFEDITWENFVQGVLGQYGKLYPVMSFLGLQDERSVITNASRIYAALNRTYDDGSLMPVTRDLSDSRLTLLNRWLRQFFNSES